MVKSAYDVLIIGSGFGGSITACRLARAQQLAGKTVSVCVLERGKRYNRGEFPRSLLRAKDWWWRNEGQGGWTGLLDFRTFENIAVLRASGVGGTSLVYLDVQIDAFHSTFDVVGPEGQKRWPSSVDWRDANEMPRYYGMVFDMLRPTPIPDPPLKTRALQAGAAGAGAGDRFWLPDLAIYWGKNGGERGVLRDDPYQRNGPPQSGCAYCGECFLGCNIHAKNTLDLNYLWLAQLAGAEIFSQHQVVSINPNRPNHPVHPDGYTVAYEDLRWGFGGEVSAGKVIVAGGALGSTELLLRAKYDHCRRGKEVKATLPRLSPRLGSFFSGNGDFGAVGFKTNRVTNPMEGPTITGVVDFRDMLGGQGFIIEEGGVPDLLRDGLKQFPGGLAASRRWIQWFQGLFHRLDRRRSQPRLVEGIFNLLDFDAVRDAMPYLVMGIDAADGQMNLDQNSGNLRLTWAHANSLPFFREIERVLRELTQAPSPGLDGNLMVNPSWSSQKELVTVHPLGGCPMGDDESKGVVDPQGEVFNYPNLYVVDGAIVPSAIGPNPSKTIGALAERAAEHIIKEGI